MTECALHKVHHPTVVVTHLVQVGDESIPICGTGKDNLEACVNYMRTGEPHLAAMIGRTTWNLAQRVIDAES